MLKSELISEMAQEMVPLSIEKVGLGIQEIIKIMIETMEKKGSIEIRGFGSFSTHKLNPRLARNPKTGETFQRPQEYRPHFKAGKALKEGINTPK